MNYSAEIRKIAFLGDYLPRKCGIATFTSDLREAVAAQVAPNRHFYIYGEPERLARPVIFLAQRGLFSEAEWTAWFARIAQTVREDPVGTQAGLARRHNARAFLFAILVGARLSEAAEDDVLLPGAEAALRAMS